MGEKTHIQWAHSTVNIITGCSKVSPGCKNCYAERTSWRGAIGQWGDKAPRKFHERAVKLAYKLNRKPWICTVCGTAYADELLCSCETLTGLERRRIFNMSHGDWLDPLIPVEWLARLLHTMLECDQVYWLLLTKRPELFTRRLTEVVDAWGRMAPDHFSVRSLARVEDWLRGKVPQHFWFGVSVENQEYANKRVPELLKIPAAIRFLSVEPLLGPVDLCGALGDRALPKVDWVIVGGESGPGARQCDVDWIRDFVKECVVAEVPCFVKQLGALVLTEWPDEDGWPAGTEFDHNCVSRVLLKHPKGGDMAEWPKNLQMRELPDLTSKNA